MYVVRAQVVKALSGVPLTSFVKDQILTPLNMTHSTYFIVEALQSGKASETWAPFGRRIPPWGGETAWRMIRRCRWRYVRVNELVRGVWAQNETSRR
jgi:CubicO group peptidase (beta-lactamase class C family)